MDKVNFEIHVIVWLTIKIHILPNIFRIKDNQTLQFGQFIEYSKKNVLIQKSCRK